MEKIELVQNFLCTEACSFYIWHLNHDITWYNELSASDGTTVKIKRKMAYMADNVVDYQYANLSFPGQAWTNDMDFLRKDVNTLTGRNFNSVLLNLYEDGRDEIKWHSDKEPQLGTQATIYALNLGATRKFWFRAKEANSEKFFHSVSNGDLLKMNAGCQEEYLHAILQEKEVTEPRISLTFREVI